jgi:hypothetical protein
MAGQRKRYSAALKAKVALEAIKGQKTTNEIAAEYADHPVEEAGTRWLAQPVREPGKSASEK